MIHKFQVYYLAVGIFMSEIKWGLISNGTIFQSLVGTLIRYKDPEVQIYERPGPDAGIDIKSGDGKTVYQAKYIQDDNKFLEIINKAKRELEKIKTYKDKHHKNFKHWKKVKKWCLVTNAKWNPNDTLKWKDSIEIPFQDIGLKVELKHQADIDQYLEEYPNVKHEYFEGENRVLQSLSETIETLKGDNILFKGFKLKLIKGRENDLNLFSKFIESQDKKIICIHGPGGVGKTRLAIEMAYQASEKNYDIFWANTATLEINNNWFRSILNNRKALLIIDEPKEQRSIESLLEQAVSNKLRSWKFIIITRTSKDHILLPLNHHKLQIVEEPIQVNPLNQPDSKEFISKLIDNSHKLKNQLTRSEKQRLYKYILRVTGGFPIWMIVVIYLLEKDGNIGNLPEDQFGLAQKYLDEMLSSLPTNIDRIEFVEYVKAIVLLQPIYTQDDSSMESYFKNLLNDVRLPKLENVFQILIEKKFAIRRGRLLEIKPDVIRDYIIFKLIGGNTSESKKWLQNILKIENLKTKKSALTKLAELSFYQKHYQQNEENTFFDEIWDILSEKSKKGSLNDQYNVLEIATDISFENLVRFWELIALIKSEKKKNCSTFKYTSHDNLILKLPQAIYESSQYVRDDLESETVFKALIDLYPIESSLIKGDYHYLANDGYRTMQLISRLMKDHHPKHHLYKECIFKWIMNTINNINTLDSQILFLLKEITDEFLKIEKHDTYVEDRRFFLTKISIDPKSIDQKYRDKIFEKIWSLLQSNSVNLSGRKRFWKLLETYHHQSNQHSNPQKDNYEYWKKELERHFTFLKKYISKHDIDISELKPLVSIWNWHLDYDHREKFKKYAQECEEEIIKQKSNIYFNIKPLFEPKDDNQELVVKNCISKNNLKTSDNILSFIESCFYYDNQSFDLIIPTIARHLTNHSDISEYVDKILENKEFNHHFQFVCKIIFMQLVNMSPKKEKNAFNFLMKYWNFLIKLEQQEYFLKTVLYVSFFEEIKHIIGGYIKFISTILPTFLRNNNVSKKDCYKNCFSHISHFLGIALFSDFDQSKNLICTIFNKISPDKAYNIFSWYINGVNHRLLFLRDHLVSMDSQANVFPWLISLLRYVPSIHNEYSILNELVKIKSKLHTRFSVIDFVDMIKERFKILKTKKDSSWDNIFMKRDFLTIIDPIQNADISCKNTKCAFQKLLDYNSNVEELLHYNLPKIVATLDPLGIFIPKMICEKIQNKEFLCDLLEGIPKECEWTRYARHYRINSEPWRKIAKFSCKIASKKLNHEKKYIFSDLLGDVSATFKGTPGEVPTYFYDKVRRAETDLNRETDPNIKEFMQWRLDIEKRYLKEEKLRVSEEEK